MDGQNPNAHSRQPSDTLEPSPLMAQPTNSSTFWRNAVLQQQNFPAMHHSQPPSQPSHAQNAFHSTMPTAQPSYNPYDATNTGNAASATAQNTEIQANTSTSTRRTRITRACDTCRRKKIKCDVDSISPCTTCRQYEWECTFNDTAKKRGPPKGYIESLETRLKKMEKLLEQMDSGNGADKAEGLKRKYDAEEAEHTESHRSQSRGQFASSARSGSPSTSDMASRKQKASDNGNKVIRYHGSSSGYYLMSSMFSGHENRGSSESIEPSEEVFSEEGEPSTILPFHNIGPYRFRKMNGYDDALVVVGDALDGDSGTLSSSGNNEDLGYIVPRIVIETLVQCFFATSNPTLPILDKEQFMDAFEGRKTPSPPPLLLYAICNYACFLLPSNHAVFKEAGIERNTVFHTLSDRLRQLMRSEYLIPRVSTIQAIVILCSQPTYSTSSYRNWILAGMAVRMAQDLGLHRTMTTGQPSDDFIEARKRLWYSVYITDRWCCAVMGRPLAIADSDCDVDLPKIKPESGGGEDYAIFVNFIKLSGILGELLRRIYSPKAKAAGYQSKTMEQTVTNLQKMLDDWFDQLPEDCRISESDLAEIRQHPERFVATRKLTHGAPLTMCFHTVILLLHRPFLVTETNETSRERYSTATQMCTHAAKLVIDIARVTPTKNVTRFGWNFSVYAVFQATLIHVYNCTSNDPAVSQMANEYVSIGINDCLTTLNQDIPYEPPFVPFLNKLLSLIQSDSENTHEKDKSSHGTHQTDTSDTTEKNSHVYGHIPTTVDTQPTRNQPGNSNASHMHFQHNPPTNVTPATWQQLFSYAGSPFPNETGEVDTQGSNLFENFFSTMPF